MDDDSTVAGQELDALVAERVMGWQRWRFPNGRVELFESSAATWLPRYGAKPTTEMYTEADTSTFKASTNMAAAWQVVARLLSHGSSEIPIVVQVTGDQSQWVTTVFRGAAAVVMQKAETAPLSICRAALAAVESTSKDEN